MYTPPSARASAAYRQTDLSSQILGASPHALISLLFTELRTCLLRAAGAIERQDVQTKIWSLSKAARVLDEGLILRKGWNAGRLLTMLDGPGA